MRVKVTVSGVPIELEADSKEEFRDALEVVVATFGGFKIPPHNASFRESQTKSEAVEEVIRTSPPVTEDAPGGASSPLKRTVDYRKAKTIVQHLLIALEDLGELHGTDRHYSNNVILDHLSATGATKLFTKKRAKPIGIVGQATRDATASGLLLRVEDEHGDLEGYRLKEWAEDDVEPETQQEAEEETALGFQSLGL